MASPLDQGRTSGDGTYANGAFVTVTAAPEPGFSFVNWTENGELASASATYTFTTIVNRSLVANFSPELPRLLPSLPEPGVLLLKWPANAAGFMLQYTTNLGLFHWETVTNSPTIIGTNTQVTISPFLNSITFFRLLRP